MIEIAINNVHKNFGFNNVLRGAGFEVYTNERVGLVGRNGAGKTTLFNVILGTETPDKGAVTVRRNASIGFLEQIHQATAEARSTEAVLKEAFADVFDTEAELQRLEREMAAEGADYNRLTREYARLQNLFISLDGYSVDEEFEKIVNGFKLRALLDTPFGKLSGGEKTIVKLAALLLRKPDILLLDEPTNHLDIETLEWFEGFMAKYRGTVLMISHDRRFLDKTTTKTILTEDGVCEVYAGNYSFFVKEKERLLLQEFNEYKTQQKKIEAMKAAIKRYRQWGHEADNPKMFIKAKELEKRLEKMEILENPKPREVKLPLNFKTERGSNDVLAVKSLGFGYGDNQIFTNFTLGIRYGESVCLMGANGTGKTTLFRLILGELAPDAGELRLGYSVNVGYIPQEITFPDDKQRMLDFFRQETVCTEADARNALAKFYFIGDNVFKRAGSLSGGEKVLLKLAVLLQKKVNFLLLDEPTNHIDIATREVLEDALLGYTGTLLFISHDRYFIEKIAERRVEI